MTDVLPGIEAMIALAKKDSEKLGDLLERYRSFLTIWSKQQMNPKLRGRVGDSDILQQTFADACKAFQQFGGSTEAEFSAWISRIHGRNLDDEARKHLLAGKRNVEQERRLVDSEGTATLCWREPAARQATPSQVIIRGEKALRLADMLASLPETQAAAVRMRHIEELPVREIAEHLDVTRSAAAGLIKRGLQTLRKKMDGSSWR